MHLRDDPVLYCSGVCACGVELDCFVLGFLEVEFDSIQHRHPDLILLFFFSLLKNKNKNREEEEDNLVERKKIGAGGDLEAVVLCSHERYL